MKERERSRAVVLVSGGIDSAVTMALARYAGFDAYAMTFRYGQRHAIEVDAARLIAASMAKSHQIVDIDLRIFGGSALTTDIAVPGAGEGRGIPITYVPARNTIFLSYALAWAEIIGSERIYIGVNAIDYSGYPDCRPEYIAAFETVANLATKSGIEGKEIKIVAPLINLTKAQIISTGEKLGVDMSITVSCYAPLGRLACGNCDSCAIRRAGFLASGKTDPTIYK